MSANVVKLLARSPLCLPPSLPPSHFPHSPVFLVVQLLAPLRYPDVDIVTGLQNVVERIIQSGGPVLTTGATPVAGGVFDKLTDTRNYTGSHKQRFDEHGRGLGKEGRED